MYMCGVKRKNARLSERIKRLIFFVGATGFEPAAAWSQTRSATGLRYTPNGVCFSVTFLLVKNLFPDCECKGSNFFGTSKIFSHFF